MNPVRHIIVCEGESERTYLQRLQSYLDSLPVPEGCFETLLQFVPPKRAVAKSGKFSSLAKNYRARFKESKRSSIQIWADFDLYHRNDNKNADAYKLKNAKTPGIPDFYFSFHNFEDFLALHLDGVQFSQWQRIFQTNGHFDNPRHAKDYIPDFESIVPSYRKGDLPVDFVNQASLHRLKRNKTSQPSSNPHDLRGLRCFADFLIGEIESCYPSLLLHS